MNPLRFPLAIALAGPLLFAAGCGPGIAEQRMAYYPPRDERCSVQVLNGAMQNPMQWAGPNSPFELVGTVALVEHGSADPFSPEYVDIVRPRACKMGADAVSLMGHTETSAGIRSSSMTTYGLLRKRRAGGAPPAMHASGTTRDL